MTKPLHRLTPMYAVLMALIAAIPAFAQGGRGGRGMTSDGAHVADMQLVHQLFDHRTEITRQVVMRPDGVETVTESQNPEVTRLLQTHVASMLARVKEGRPLHGRDPLFAELFRYADQMTAKHEVTIGGVRVSGDVKGSVRGQAVTGARRSGQRLHRERPVRDDAKPSLAATRLDRRETVTP
jgi:hypothetical protein